MRLARFVGVRLLSYAKPIEKKTQLFCSVDFFLLMIHTCFAYLRFIKLRFAHACVLRLH